MPQATILIVEDELVIALDVSEMLRSFGYAVCQVVSRGEDVIEKVREFRPDLILMDIKIKGAIDGVDAAAQVQAEFDTPVIYVTAFADSETLKRARVTTPYGYLVKPVEARALHTAIEIALYKHQSEQLLKQHERWLAAILGGIGEGVIATDAEDRVTFLNPTAEGLTGWLAADASGRSVGDVIHLMSVSNQQLIEDPLLTDRRSSTAAADGSYVLLMSKDGRAIPIERTIMPMRDARNLVVGHVLSLRDISARLESEQVIRTRNRELALLNYIIAFAANSDDPEAMLQTVCAELASALGADRVFALLMDQQQAGATVVAECIVNGRLASLGSHIEIDDLGWYNNLLKSGAPVVVTGSMSLLAAPISVRGQVIGTLCVEAAAPGFFSTDRSRLVCSVADEVAGAVARARLAQAQQRLATAIEQAAESVLITDAGGRIVYANPAFERMTGYGANLVLGQDPRLLRSGDNDADFYQDMWQTLARKQVWRGRIVNRRRDGSLFTADSVFSPVLAADGNIVAYISLQRDVTHELELEERYFQSRKMEALGQMAAGIAHDFNNLLTPIIGYAELMRKRAPADPAVTAMADSILTAARRGVDLITHLLAFTRKQVIQPNVLDLNSVAGKMSDVLPPLLGEAVHLRFELAPDLMPIMADASQIERIILNLALNGRDAMPSGGDLIIRTASCRLQNNSGEWESSVLLEIKDSGTGMTPEVRAHLFEPFFTTKELGKGTGLGLATVHGIVAQHRGYIEVESEPGAGTTFRVFLPAQPAVGSCHRCDLTNTPTAGDATIMLVEDDEANCLRVSRVLADHGYRVIPAHGNTEALQILEHHDGVIDLVIIGAGLAPAKGHVLATRVARSAPHTRVLVLSSGAGSDGRAGRWLAARRVMLGEPLDPLDLIEPVRQVLTQSPNGPLPQSMSAVV